MGTSYPNKLLKVRELVENSYILIPGYGAQSAEAKDCKYGFNKNGLGAIVNSSRDIIYVYNKHKLLPERFTEAAREEIIDMNKKTNN